MPALWTMKRGLGRAITSTPAVRLFHPATRGLATVFLLHRFDVADPGVNDVSSATLRRVLEHLRRFGHEILSIEELARRFVEGGPPLRGAVCFTVDDGYRDQALTGAPLFAAYDAPVTVFLTTGFLDGTLVPWWDQIRHVFGTTERTALQLHLGPDPVSYAWSTVAERVWCQNDAKERVKDVDDATRLDAIRQLAAQAGVDLLQTPAEPNRPMTWDDARRLERQGVTFGPHTVTHPLLSDLDDERAAWEMRTSWGRLCEELADPCPVFAYPNGRPVDFGPREMAVAEELGLMGAVQVSDTWARPVPPQQAADARWRIDRIPFPADGFDAVQYVCGLERVVRSVRRVAPRAGRPGPPRR